MKKVRRVRWWSMLAILIASMFLVPADAFAQRRSGSRSRSTSRAKPARTTKPAKTSRGKATGKASKKKGTWGSDKKKVGKSRAQKKADRDLYAKAKAKGTTFKDRKSAAADFKKKNAAKYSSKYASKPTTRPGHIPPIYASGGTTYNVSYNQGYGGYGYMGPSGSWIMYNAMADVAMAGYWNNQMRTMGYYYGAPPSRGVSPLAIVIVIGLVVVVAIVVLRRPRSATSG